MKVRHDESTVALGLKLQKNLVFKEVLSGHSLTGKHKC